MVFFKNPLIIPVGTLIVSCSLLVAGWIIAPSSHPTRYFILLCGIYVIGVTLLIYLQGAYSSNLVAKLGKESSRLHKFEQAIEQSSNHMIITDPDGVILYANKAAQIITGYDFNQMQGNTPRLWGRQMPSEFYKHLWHTIKTLKQPFSGQFTNIRQNGEKYIAKATISPILDPDNQLLGFIGMEEDITSQVTDQEKITEYMNRLEKLNRLMVDREVKMIELKKQLNSSTPNTQ